MYRFLLYSLIVHSLIVALLFVSILFTPKSNPKQIQIKLAVLPKNNNIKKTAPSTEIPKVEEQEETPEQAKEKADQVQKLLDNVLKEDITEKDIEKSVPQKEVYTDQIKTQSAIKEIPRQVSKEIPKQKEIIKNNSKPNRQKQEQIKEQKQEDISIYNLPEKQDIPIQSNTKPLDSKLNPYSNPVMPPVIPLEIPKIEIDNSDTNQVLPTEEEIVIIPEALPSLPIETIKPKRKEIDVSKVKDDNVAEEANRITKQSSGISNDIMSSKAFYLTSNDKKVLMNQMSQCLASLGMIRENDETLTLLIEMEANAKIKDINIVKENKIIPKSDLSNLESRVLYLFNNPKCSKLILPEGKFSYWQKFTIKLNLKGLFG